MEMSEGVKALIARMGTKPEEFYDDSRKWTFIFKDKYKEVLTEQEKGAIHTALLQVRRKEFDANVLSTILQLDEEDEEEKVNKSVKNYVTATQIKEVAKQLAATAPRKPTTKGY